LDKKQILNLINIEQTETTQSLTVYYEPNKWLSARGSNTSEEMKIPRNRIDSIKIPE
jgi:hypothetical protein